MPLPTFQARFQRAKRDTRLRTSLRNTTGAIDLASIMVGVIVIGTISGVIAATVFAVIPWSQTKAAQGDLDAIRTAESVARVMTGSYMTVDELVAAGYLQQPSSHNAAGAASGVSLAANISSTVNVNVIVGAGGSCYVAGAKADNGSIFYSTSKNSKAFRFILGVSTTDECAPAAPMISALGGVTDGSVPPAPVMIASALAASSVGETYTAQVSASGNPASFSVNVGALPPGLNLNTATGEITGTPTTAGTFSFDVAASNSGGTSNTARYTITVGARITTVGFTEHTAAAGARQYFSTASSDSGAVLYAGAVSSNLMVSTDGGLTWNPRLSPTGHDIVTFGDGTRAIALTGSLYQTSNSGALWTQMTPLVQAKLLTISGDGTKITVVDQNNYFASSIDSGASWTTNWGAGASTWLALTTSADGTRLAASKSGTIFTATDPAGTWTERSTPSPVHSLASSGDGMKLVAGTSNGNVLTSSDAGVTWVKRSTPVGSWKVDSSADGSALVAVHNGGQLYVSSDSGATWKAHGANMNWNSISASVDGMKFLATTSDNRIFTGVIN